LSDSARRKSYLWSKWTQSALKPKSKLWGIST